MNTKVANQGVPATESNNSQRDTHIPTVRQYEQKQGFYMSYINALDGISAVQGILGEEGMASGRESAGNGFLTLALTIHADTLTKEYEDKLEILAQDIGKTAKLLDYRVRMGVFGLMNLARPDFSEFPRNEALYAEGIQRINDSGGSDFACIKAGLERMLLAYLVEDVDPMSVASQEYQYLQKCIERIRQENTAGN